jgi:undecaprenyl-diphosphatase
MRLVSDCRQRGFASKGAAGPSFPAPEPCMLDQIQTVLANDFVRAAVLGVVEGLTEFLPVSSTGHLLLVQHFFGFHDESFGRSFSVLIQLGAILAILSIYFGRLWNVFLRMFSEWAALRFAIGLVIAFLPAAVIGAFAYSIIKSVLFDVQVVCVSLVVGGIILLWVDRLDLRPFHHDAQKFSLPMYFSIGFFQCLSMIPGVSRSGTTIVSAMFMGADKRSAAEFSFYLAIPTMTGAFAYDLYKNHALMTTNNTLIVAVGFVSSFIVAYIVVRTFLDFVTRHGFALFAWWRILLGGAGLIALALGA